MLHRQSRARAAHTAAAADPAPRDDYDHKVNDRVRTCDGHLGTVTAIDDGPFPGTEGYCVTLDAGMGGGHYTPGQLQPAPAALTGTAAADYPELAQTITDHPDPGRRTAMQRVAAFDELGAYLCDTCGDEMPEPGSCRLGNHYGDENSGHELIGEHGHAPDGRPIEHSIGAACPHCKTPLSQESARYGCVYCGGHDHHSYCCPNPDGHTAQRTAAMTCPGCGDPMSHAQPCPRCGQYHHNGPGCCAVACEDCGRSVMDTAGHRQYCGHCGMGDHHTGCCTSEEALKGITDLFSGPEWDTHRQYMDGNQRGPSRMSARS